MDAEPVTLAEEIASIPQYWSPRIVARLNNYDVKVVKLGGEFVWHTHPDTDELFLILAGTLTIELRDRDVTVAAGQVFVVPRGVEHRPVTTGEVHAVLIEPAGVVNTGSTGGPLTATSDDVAG